MSVLDTLAMNLGAPVDVLLFFLTMIGSASFFAEDMRIGLIGLLLMLAVDYFVLAFFGYSVYRVIMMIFTVICFMAISLWIQQSKRSSAYVN